MNDERKTQLSVAVDGSAADAGFDKIKQGAKDMAQAVSTSAEAASKGVDSIGAKAQTSAQKVERAERSIIASIQRRTAALEAAGKGERAYQEALISSRGYDPARFAPFLNQLDAAVKKQEQARLSIAGYGVSAAQTAAALRGVPAQFTDIVTSIQGGQKPLTVLLQQGGQLKDMFGGAAPAARALGGYVLSLINPLTIALGLAAGLAYAFSKGRDEADGLVRALQGNGLRTGTTVSQLNELAKALSGEGFTRGAAAEALGAIASTGAVAADNLKKFAATALDVEKFGGQSFDKTAKAFQELADKPTEATLKFNTALNYLSAAQFQQIQMLEEQGRKTDAARLAQDLYNDAIEGSIAHQRASLGYLETSWNGVKDAAKWAWDAMAGVGRPDTADERIAELRAKLADLQDPMKPVSTGFKGGAYGFGVGAVNNDAVTTRDKLIAQTRAQLDSLVKLNQATQDNAKFEAERQKREQAGIVWAQEGQKYLSAQAKLEQEIQRIRNQGAAAGASEDDIARRVAVARENASKGKENKEAVRALEQYRNLVADLNNESGGLSAGFNEQVKILIQGWRMSGDAVEVYDRAYGQLLAKQPFAVKAAKDQAEAEKQLAEENKKRLEEAARAYTADVKAAERSAQSVADRVQAMQDEQVALEQSRLLNISLAEALERVHIARLNDAVAIAQQSGQTDKVAALQKEIDARRELAKLNDVKLRRDQGNSALDSILKADIKTDFSAGFDKSSQSLGTFVETFGKLIEQQDLYNKARADSKATTEQLNALDVKHARMQVNSYASLAGAAKGFFSERSKGYQALLVAEQTLRAVELAGSIASIGQSLVEGQAKAAVGVANQANGDPYSAFPRMAAMAGIMAALGFVVAGASGGKSSGPAVALNTGTGTVFGDPAAASESIKKSIERLKDVDTITMRYSGEMLASLRNIESSLAGVAGQIIRNGTTLTGGNFTGSTSVSSLVGTADKLASVVLPVVNALFGGVARKIDGLIFGKTTTSLADSGLQFYAQSLDSILNGGIVAQGFQTIQKKKSALFGLSKSTSTSTSFSGLDDNLTNQFTNLIRDTYNSVIEANQALGVSAQDTAARVNGLTVDLGRISLKGLSSSQIQERLTAVFGSFADNLALSANSGFTTFQKAGEGYFETLTRVASGFETATTLLDRLGVSAVALSAIQRTQGDVAAELVRQSLQAQEGLSGVADVLGLIDGTAQEIADAYTSLTDVRTTLKLLGVDGAAVGPALLRGAGSLGQLTDAVKAFEDGFFTDGQKITNQAERLALQFGKLGYALPKSSGDFVALVQGIDTSTEAGQKLLGSVLNLSGGFADLLSAIKDATGGIANEIERIKGLSNSGGTKSVAQLQAEFAISTAQARAGDQAAINLLPSISQALLKAAEATASSSIDVAVIQAQTLASLQVTLDAISDPTKRLKGYASGGDFGGGWRIVGERGSELEATGPARIFSADQTARILAASQQDSQAAAEVRELRRELAALRDDQRIQTSVLAANTGRTARILEAVTPDGTSLATSAA